MKIESDCKVTALQELITKKEIELDDLEKKKEEYLEVNKSTTRINNKIYELEKEIEYLYNSKNATEIKEIMYAMKNELKTTKRKILKNIEQENETIKSINIILNEEIEED